jgi:hypothetical protein
MMSSTSTRVRSESGSGPRQVRLHLLVVAHHRDLRHGGEGAGLDLRGAARDTIRLGPLAAIRRMIAAPGALPRR